MKTIIFLITIAIFISLALGHEDEEFYVTEEDIQTELSFINNYYFYLTLIKDK